MQRYPLIPTTKQLPLRWAGAIAKDRQSIVKNDETIKSGFAEFAFKDPENRLLPDTKVMVFYRGIDNLYCVVLEEYLAVQLYDETILQADTLLKKTLTDVAFKRTVLESKLFNSKIKLPVVWSIVQINIRSKNRAITHIQINEKLSRRGKGQLLCGAPIGKYGTIYTSHELRITCPKCLANASKYNDPLGSFK